MAFKGGSDDLVRLLVVGGVLYGGYTMARKPNAPLGATLKNWADYIHDNLIDPNPSPVPGLGAKTGGDPEIEAWARGIGLSYEVGWRFKQDNAHLPYNIAELESWGNSKGYRKSDGSWTI